MTVPFTLLETAFCVGTVPDLLYEAIQDMGLHRDRDPTWLHLHTMDNIDRTNGKRLRRCKNPNILWNLQDSLVAATVALTDAEIRIPWIPWANKATVVAVPCEAIRLPMLETTALQRLDHERWHSLGGEVVFEWRTGSFGGRYERVVRE